MPDQDFVLAPATVNVGFALAPTMNVLGSLNMINEGAYLSGLSAWIEEIRQNLPEERLRANSMILNVLFPGEKEEHRQMEFPEYLDYFDSIDPHEMFDTVIQRCCDHFDILHGELANLEKDAFLDAVEKRLGPKYAQKEIELDLEPYADAYPLLNDPVAMYEAVSGHFHYMWEEHLAEEWEKRMPMLQESVNAFQTLDFRGQTALEVARIVTGRDLTHAMPDLDMETELIFVPSPHIGPYVIHYGDKDGRSYMIFGARVPQGVRSQSPAVNRSELLTRLNALADDTRLSVVELLTRNEEMCAQDIMNILNLTQSSASRHLRQLSATGFVTERRREQAKCYQLNMERVDDTLRTLKHFLYGRPTE
jgi:DNA-binding transcriptional ArsR family regulator